MKNFINHIFQIQFQQFLRLSFMVTCQSSELDWEVNVELPADFLSLGRGSASRSTNQEYRRTDQDRGVVTLIGVPKH